MRTFRTCILVMVLLFAAITVYAGGRAEATDTPRHRVVFTQFSGTNPIARDIAAGFENAAERLGIDLWVMDNQLDPVQMVNNANLAVAAGDVDFYILYTNDIASNPQIMDILVAADIPVVTIATAAIASDGTTAPLVFSMEDNYEQGYAAAKNLGNAAKDLGWQEEEMIFISMGFLEAGGVFLERSRGALEGMQSVFPNIEYIETSSTGSAEVARQRTVDILTNNPGRKFVCWTHSDDVTAGMIAAIETTIGRENGLIVSGGLNMGMLDMLRDSDGILVGSIDSNFMGWGDHVLPLIVDYLENGVELEPIISTPWEFLTPATVDAKYPR